MRTQNLQIQHLNRKMLAYVNLRNVDIPPVGWIKAIRLALGMSLEQLGKRLSITRQSVRAIEEREKEGSITLKSLREVGRALDMQLVYGFVPNDGSLEALIERRATELATQIVLRTAHSMALEDQGNSDARLETAIRERAVSLKSEMPKILWD